MEDDIRYRQYLQWQAAEQWARTRAAARPVALFGDLPFMVDGDSADVWARQHQFRFDASVGAPPDAFSEEGQKWGLPPCDWRIMAEDGFAWIRERARRAAELFDGFRIDHLVGFYRTYIVPADGSPRGFLPAEEPEQLALGEALVQIFTSSAARVIAEDLGTVPDFVRESLDRLGVPGFKVLRWERHWHQPGQPFRDPAAYPVVSVAATGTHDTEPLATWWDELPPPEREAVGALSALRRQLGEQFDFVAAPFDARLRDALLRAAYEARSDLLILPVQDLFGWRDRINIPATICDTNWTWRLPWLVDALEGQPLASERAEAAARWAAETGRLGS
jgi:4-alpha-glucanotransferase